MARSNRRLEAAVVIFFVVVLVVVGGVALNVFLNIAPPVHTDAAAVPASGGAAAEGYSAAVAKTRALTRALLVRENLPGLSVAVAIDGKIVWAEGFGYASVERHTPVTPNTRFRTGSVSKTLTAAAAALLYDRGRIDRSTVPGGPSASTRVSRTQPRKTTRASSGQAGFSRHLRIWCGSVRQ